MSIKAIDWAMRQRIRERISEFNLSADENSQIKEITASSSKIVLLAIANYADDEGRGWPSQKVLARDTELSKSSVYRRLQDLERLSRIRRTGQTRAGRGRTVDLYELAMNSSPSSCEGRPVILKGGPLHWRRDTDEPSIEPNNKLRPQYGKGRRATSGRPIGEAQHPSIIGADRGTFELQIANRIGGDGFDVLMQLSENEVDELCARQRRGTLGESEIAKLRLRARKVRGVVPKS